jgi:hypothetical protein
VNFAAGQFDETGSKVGVKATPEAFPAKNDLAFKIQFAPYAKHVLSSQNR